MVAPAPAVEDGSLYADCRSAGPYPDGRAAAAAGWATPSMRRAPQAAPVDTRAQARSAFRAAPAGAADTEAGEPAAV